MSQPKRVIENPAPASAAVVLANEVGGGAPRARGWRGYVNQVVPMLTIGAGVAGGYVASNIIRGNISAPVAGMIFNKDKVTPNQALFVDWLFQIGGAVLAATMLPKKVGYSVAGGIMANTVVATVKQLMPAVPGQTPNILQKNLDVLVFRPSAPQAQLPAQGIMNVRNRALAGILPKPMRY